MIVYHGTSNFIGEKIKEDGFFKVTTEDTAVYDVESSSGTVPGFAYLTDSVIVALNFAIRTWSIQRSKHMHDEDSPRLIILRFEMPDNLQKDPDPREFDKSLLEEMNATDYVFDKDIPIKRDCKGIAYFLFPTTEKAYACVDGLAGGILKKEKIKWKSIDEYRDFNSYYDLL